jgi:hypothetical protein
MPGTHVPVRAPNTFDYNTFIRTGRKANNADIEGAMLKAGWDPTSFTSKDQKSPNVDFFDNSNDASMNDLVAAEVRRHLSSPPSPSKEEKKGDNSKNDKSVKKPRKKGAK